MQAEGVGTALRRRWQGEGVGRVHIKQGGVCCYRCDTELKLVMQPITACAGRCGHAVASVGAVRAPSRDSYRRCALLVYDIVRYLGAAIIAGLPHPRSISRYRLIDKNPNHHLISKYATISRYGTPRYID